MNTSADQKWFAWRGSVSARTDEDAAMASQTEGPFESQGVAHVELAKMIEHEVQAWRRQNMDPARDERALARVRAGETDVTEGGVRWRIVEITGNPAPTAKYKAGDRLHFRPTPERAPFGTAIDEGDVIVTEVVDHGHATHTSPRFTYVVRELNGAGTQGTDDRELSEIEPTAAPAKVRGPARVTAGSARFA